MFKLWLETDAADSWNKIVSALEASSVDMNTAANNLKSKFST